MATTICALNAKSLPNEDWWPKDVRPDPYVTISLMRLLLVHGRWYQQVHHVFGRSGVVQNSNAPMWNTCCTLDIPKKSFLREQKTLLLAFGHFTLRHL